MASLFDFIAKLNPCIKKAEVQKDLEGTMKELSTFVMPMVKSMGDTVAVSPFKNDWNGVFESHVRDGIKFARKSNNIWLDLYAALTNVQANGTSLGKFINSYLQEDTLRDGITAKAAHMVRLTAYMSYITSYILEVSDYLVAEECVALGGESEIPPAQAKYIREGLAKFVATLKELSIPNKEFEAMFSSIPDVFMSKDNSQTITGMFSSKQLDPFTNLRVINNWSGSPIFAIRMMWETYQADRFHAAKERKTLLELRLIHLQNKHAESPNPRLESEIEGLQARINKYDRKIREVEASL